MINLNTLIARSFIISFMLISILSSNGESNESKVPITSFNKYYKEFTSINSYYADMNLKVVTRISAVTPSQYLDNPLEFQSQEQLESHDSKLNVEQDFKDIQISMQQMVFSLYQEWKDDNTITLIKSFPKPEKTATTPIINKFFYAFRNQDQVIAKSLENNQYKKNNYIPFKFDNINPIWIDYLNFIYLFYDLKIIKTNEENDFFKGQLKLENNNYYKYLTILFNKKENTPQRIVFFNEKNQPMIKIDMQEFTTLGNHKYPSVYKIEDYENQQTIIISVNNINTHIFLSDNYELNIISKDFMVNFNEPTLYD